MSSYLCFVAYFEVTEIRPTLEKGLTPNFAKHPFQTPTILHHATTFSLAQMGLEHIQKPTLWLEEGDVD